MFSEPYLKLGNILVYGFRDIFKIYILK